MKSLQTVLLTGLACAFFLSACDLSEQNIEWDPGNSLAIVGPLRAGATSAVDDDADTPGIQLYLPVHPAALDNSLVHFYIRGFNSDRTYAWTVNGAPAPSLQGGEFTSFNVPTEPLSATYTVQATNDRQIGGQLTLTALYPKLSIQIPRFAPWSQFRAALSDTPINAALAGTDAYTVLAPVNAAFDDIELPEEEDDLIELLGHHVFAGTLRLADITDGMTRTTLAGTTLTFHRSGDAVSVSIAGGNQANLVAPRDIRAANGVVHGISAVLQPSE